MLRTESPQIDLEKEKITLFRLGEVCATHGASEAFRKAEVSPLWFLAKHQDGDWGEVSQDDEADNNLAVRVGFRILSAYTLPKTGEKIWIITEADRLLTTILLPEEY